MLAALFVPAARGPGPAVVAPPMRPPAGSVRLGLLAPHRAMTVDVVLRPHHADALAALAMAVSTPGTDRRGEYATPLQLYAEFSPSKVEVRRVTEGLTALGLSVVAVTPDRLTLSVAGSVAELSRALHTSFSSYRLPGGRVAYANTSAAELPEAIGSRVEEVIGLSDVVRVVPFGLSFARTAGRSAGSRLDRRAPRRAGSRLDRTARTSRETRPSRARTVRKATDGQPAAPKPCAAVGAARASGGYTANELARAYKMTRLYQAGDLGAGVNVGIVELERNARSDVAAYESCYGISTRVNYIEIDHGARGNTYGSGEAALDIENVAGLAPEATIDVYQAPNDSTGPYDEIEYIVDHPIAQVVTTSWGECEADLGPNRASALVAARAENTLFELAAAEGQTWLAAAGDDGSTDCAGTTPSDSTLSVDDPGSQVFVTAVGGTQLTLGGRGKREVVWNVTGEGATGGGVSELWAMPPYQRATPESLHVVSEYSSSTPCDAMGNYCREVPDVSADADPETGYIIYFRGRWTTGGGTSAAAPLWAAAIALVDGDRACRGEPVGLLDPALYKIASSRLYASSFTDITSGDNAYSSSGYDGDLYPAGPGYSMAAGLGTPLLATEHAGLASALCSSLEDVRPGVLHISPDSGPRRGGNRVTVFGYGFGDVTSVYVGNHKVTKFGVGRYGGLRPTKLFLTMPPGSGSRWVLVRSSGLANARTPGDEYVYDG